MTREDIEDHINKVMDGEKTVETKLHCNHCGSELEDDNYVTWEIPATPSAGIDSATEYFCDDECKDQHKRDIINGAL